MMNLKLKLIFPLVLIFISVVYHSHFEFLYNIINIRSGKEEKSHVKVFSPEELSQFRGISKQNLYVAVLGTVFDVTKGKNHYGIGSPYHYFTGKDGSRALVTGDFQDESGNSDHIMDLSCDDLATLLNWRNTFRNKYKHIGILHGRYFDKYGGKTDYYNEFIKKIEECKQAKEIASKKDQVYPPCNIEWSEEHGTKVWCSQNSGGITRNWVGVPRQYYEPGEVKPHCVCIKDNKDVPVGHVKEYNNCPKTSTTCLLPVN